MAEHVEIDCDRCNDQDSRPPHRGNYKRAWFALSMEEHLNSALGASQPENPLRVQLCGRCAKIVHDAIEAALERVSPPDPWGRGPDSKE